MPEQQTSSQIMDQVERMSNWQANKANIKAGSRFLTAAAKGAEVDVVDQVWDTGSRIAQQDVTDWDDDAKEFRALMLEQLPELAKALKQ